MNTFEDVLFLGLPEERRYLRYITDTVLATVLSLLITGIIYLGKLYPTIPNISFLYLLVVLALSVTRGLYASLVTSLIAFLSFDFTLVQPLFTFTIAKTEEWLALIIFMITAIVTGRLASGLRQRAMQASAREREARALYELVNATTSEDRLGQQLDIVAKAIVENFASFGVCDCAILLPGTTGRLALEADASQDVSQLQISLDEMRTAESVMSQGRIIDLYAGDEAGTGVAYYRFRRIVDVSRQNSQRYMRFVPLQQGHEVIGVVRLVMSEKGRRFPTERNANMKQEQLGHNDTFFWTFLDQTSGMIEHARLQREMLQIELLKRTDSLRSALLSSVSHDLRTPLASIKASASSLLQEDVEWDDETKRSFAITIERESDRLNRLVGNLLDMSRIEGGALKPEKEWYPIDEVIHDVVDRMRGILQGREIQTHLSDDLPPVEIDYLQMDQVITNLLENAARYTPIGSPIEVSAEVIDGEVKISIADRGPGIPADDLERIFDKFYRVSGTPRKGNQSSTMGTGLGLAVCRGLVEAHGGHIWAANRPDGGAIFQFTLPVSPFHIQQGRQATPLS